MTDWSREMAAKLKRRSEGQNLRDAKFLETQKMKREIGPSIWAATRSDALSQGIALNAEMGREIITQETTSSEELILLANLEDGVRRIHVRFAVESGKLSYATDRGIMDTVELAVGLDGKFGFHSGMVPRTTGSVAKQILEALLD